MSDKYNDSFYADIDAGSFSSAEVCLPIFERFLDFNTVVDVGSGSGAWSYQFSKYGCKVTSIDGDYATKNYDKFQSENLLINFLPKKLDAEGALSNVAKHDLAISLEVAEHLPNDRAKSFVHELCHLSNKIIFSAAIPYQGGTGHENENWLQYWAKLFADNGFRYLDPFRHLIWNNSDVMWWYKQNLCLFVSDEELNNLCTELQVVEFENIISMIHPEMYIWAIHRGNTQIRNSYGKDKNHYFNALKRESVDLGSSYGLEFE